MADTIVELNAHVGTYYNGMFGPYGADSNVSVVLSISSAHDVILNRTIDAGATWAQTVVEAGTVRQLGCFFDKEVPGDAGNVVHIAWLESSGEVRYRGYDVALGSFVSATAVAVTGITVANTTGERVSIGKTISGNLIVAYETAVQFGCIKTSDNFSTSGSSISDIFEAANASDRCHLFPANTDDDADMAAIYLDRSASTISLKMFDDSANTWTETAISGVYNQTPANISVDAALRHSDSNILIAAHSDDDSMSDDLVTIEVSTESIASPSISIKTNIFTNQAEAARVAIVINQQTNDVYVAYLKGGVWLATVDAVYHQSTDNMGSWGSEQVYSADAADDIRLIHGGHTVGNSGGRIQFCFFNSDFNYIFINLNNGIEISGKHRSLYMAIEYEGILESITPDDSNDISMKGILYVGTAGDVEVTAINNTDGTSIVLKNVPSGTWLNFIRVKRVWAANTTATDIVLAR